MPNTPAKSGAKGRKKANAPNLLPLKIGLAIACIGGMGGVLLVLVGPKGLLAVPLLGAALGVTLLAYRGLVKWSERRKSRPFERRLRDAATVTPRAGADAARRARLEDIRKRFEEGIEVFRQHGKDLYSVPWYLMVGEPGSGKTEAVRHCGVGFPPGLQNTLQGTGGTLNMNWWFTSNAVILDTAGRLIFEDIEPGTGSEWTEFLKMLRSARPNCPINGLLLVLPADSLIKDSGEEIAHKADRIAAQLNVIQQALGVRFPVFLLVTKADLINGFREFFDSIKDPLLQHQILGWSNPAPLGEPFEPDGVDRLLDGLRQRLRRRRLGLLLDPVHTEDALARRFDQVDALYAFPEAVMQLAPRLKRYLESIFVSGVWGEPPFLRGIYFTSAMRDGSALDADLAEALGIPVDHLPEGRAWKKDRSYFLRELFLKKVFRERGLVTRATNVQRLQRARRTAVLATGLAAVLVAIAVTWVSGQRFRETLNGHQRLWSDLRAEFVPEGDRTPATIVVERSGGRPGFDYDGDRELRLGPVRTAVARFAPDVLPWVEREVSVPAIFAPVARGFGDLDEMRRSAFRVAVERSTIVPVVDAARRRLAAETAESWTDDSTLALRQLIRVEAGLLMGSGGGLDLGVLARYALADTPDDAESAAKAIGESAAAIAWSYSPTGGGVPWPPPALRRGTPETVAVLTAGVQRFVERWRAEVRSGGVAGVDRLANALETLERAETAILADESVARAGSVEEFDRAARAWADAAKRCDESARAVAEALAQLNADDAETILAAAEREAQSLRERIRLAFTPLEAELGRVPDLAALQGELSTGRTLLLDSELAEQAGRLRKALSGTGARYLATDGSGLPVFERRRLALARLADSLALAETRTPTDLGARLAEIERRTRQDRESIAQAGFNGAQQRLLATLDAAAKRQRNAAIDAALVSLSGGPDRLRSLVAARAAGLTPLPRAAIPLTPVQDGAHDPEFHPEAAAWLFETVSDIVSLTHADGSVLLAGGELSARARDLLDAASAYADAYVAYWAMQAPAASAVSFGVRADWNSAHGSLSRLNAIDVCNALRAAAEAAQQALSGVPAWASEQARKRAADASLLASDARARLATDGLVQRCEQGVREWVSLGGDPEKARQAVLALEPDALTTRFLVGGKDAGYWEGVWMAALRTLAESGQSESRAAIDLLRVSRGIPLCRDSDRTLDAGRVADAFRAANDVRAAIAGSPADRSGARTLAEGARTNLPDIDREIERMRGGVVLPGQRGQAWFQGLCAILDALHAHDDPLSFQVIALPADQHPDGLPPFEAFGLFEAGIRKTNPDGRSRFRLVPGAPTDTVGGIVVPGGEIEVRFYDNEADGAPAVASAIIPAPWTMLGAIASWGGQPLHGEGLDGAWGVIILARRTGDPDSRIPVRIGLRPNRSLPHPAQWPSESSWPE
ncbi:MAG: hypothetical protein DYG93_10480 [Leptolyngbya sp. PLA2]|nr:hypothetical protein [Leptolyngbya sp. PL-A2]MCQ3940364.1 hypothetical protein [cyanobacterium CYA1]MCZ7633826.1 hypothetical protein [Phycisphaerales bacterium]MDL1904213.1 hypothetical protein [Synechococcales cyanobacterium CNB]GIK19443.1 MAG: hypothetical protein BroJett004_16070 [Planctomycetota bacterium]